MGTRKRQNSNQNGRQAIKHSRRRRTRRKRNSELDTGFDSGSDFEFSDNESPPKVIEKESKSHKNRSSEEKTETRSGISLKWWTTLLILLIAATCGIYICNFGDMTEALNTLQSRLSTIIAPKRESIPTENMSGSPPVKSEPKGNPKQSSASAEPQKKKPYARASITNTYDYKIKNLLDEADGKLERATLREALQSFDKVLEKYPQSARARYGKAQVLDKMSEQQKSNSLLAQCIEEYLTVLGLDDVSKELFVLAGKRAADRQTFRGWQGKAVKTLSVMVNTYPTDTSLRNSLAIGYLLAHRNEDARTVFQSTLKMAPNDGIALVHLGFIVKSIDNKMKEGIVLLQRGIDTGDEGTMDGRFIFHLGDAYYRTGQHNKSYDVYKVGANNGLFKSYWQRSLYNVDRLAAHPWWTMEETKIEKNLKVLMKNWRTIRDEGVDQLNAEGKFQDESENLLNTGGWKQLTLFSQGRKNKKACMLAPKTCALIEQIPEAAGCRRGQVKYSVMHPGTHVWPHCGPTNCRIRAHLGLVVPEGPQIRVGEKTGTWEEGEFTIFDDSFEHEVWHTGSSFRLVLIVDLWHPEVTQHERETLSAI